MHLGRLSNVIGVGGAAVRWGALIAVAVCASVPVVAGAIPRSELRPDFRRAACGLAFPIDALTGPIGAERTADPAAVALRRLFRKIPQYIFGERGPWRLLLRTPHVAVFASGGLPVVKIAALEKNERGRWRYAGSTSGCAPHVVRTGFSGSELELDPAYPLPAPTDTTLHLLVTESACASGQPSDDRVLPPTIYARPRAITITYFVKPLRGFQNCQGNPPAAVELDLGEPLGDRRLMDGQTVISKQRFP